MKNILFPTDFSKNSWNAIRYAIQLYKNEQCTFHLFNTYTPNIYNIEYVLVSPAQFGLGDAVRNSSQEGLSKLLIRISKEFKNNPNHIFETVARFDSLISGMRDIIRERKVDIIVMGTNGATGAKEMLFGSNTVQAFKNIKCPILAIPSNFEFEKPLEILFPSDLEIDYMMTPLDLLKELAILNHSRVNVLNVSTGYDLTETQNSNLKKLEELFKESSYLYHSENSMEIADAINKFQIKNKINLLTMINNKHSIFENIFFNNTINQIGLHLNIPFLVIPTVKI